jgi:hypothetical protein
MEAASDIVAVWRRSGVQRTILVGSTENYSMFLLCRELGICCDLVCRCAAYVCMFCMLTGYSRERALARLVAVASGHAARQRWNPGFDAGVSHGEQCFPNNLQPGATKGLWCARHLRSLVWFRWSLEDAVFGSECSCRTVCTRIVCVSEVCVCRVGVRVRVWIDSTAGRVYDVPVIYGVLYDSGDL